METCHTAGYYKFTFQPEVKTKILQPLISTLSHKWVVNTRTQSQWSLTYTRWTQSTFSTLLSNLRSPLILCSHLCLDLTSNLFPSVFFTRTLYALLFFPIYAKCPAHSTFLKLILITPIWWDAQIMKLLNMHFL